MMAPVNDRRRPPRPQTKPKPAAALTGPIELDVETRNALILFNARIEAQEAVERDKRRVDKAARAKDDAAARVRQLDDDSKATAEAKAEAQAAYMAALDAWNRAKAGEPDPPRGGRAAVASDGADAEDASDEVAAVDDAGAEDASDAVVEAPAAAVDDSSVDDNSGEDEPAAPAESDGDG